jgi:hypothetical protein
MTRCSHKDCSHYLFSDEELEYGICDYHIEKMDDECEHVVARPTWKFKQEGINL